MSYQSLPFIPEFKIEVVSPSQKLELSNEENRVIEETWVNEQNARGGKLYNNKILSLIHVDQNGLTGAFVDYKLYFAQFKNPSLKNTLKIIPVSLSAITRAQNHLLIAKRSSLVTQYPGCFELAPSGGFDDSCVTHGTINWRKALENELEEEVNIGPEKILKAEILAVVQNLKGDGVNLCLDVEIDFTPPKTSSEYSQVNWIPLDEVAPFIAKHKTEFVPLSLYLLRQFNFRMGRIGHPDL